MDFPRTFRPREKGLGKILGDLETAIMEIVWDRRQVCVRDVYDDLRGQRKIVYTTVMTVMGRLADKGLLRKELQANKHIYCPVYSREQVLDMVSREVLEALFSEDREPALSHLVDVFDRLDRGELERLKECINQAIQDQDKGGATKL